MGCELRRSIAPPKKMVSEQGSTMVEFVFVLVFLFLFTMAFLQIVGVLIAHERVSYSAYIGARINSVHGKYSKAVTRGHIFLVERDTVAVQEHLLLPMSLSKLFTPGGEPMTIDAQFSLPIERSESGDN